MSAVATRARRVPPPGAARFFMQPDEHAGLLEYGASALGVQNMVRDMFEQMDNGFDMNGQACGRTVNDPSMGNFLVELSAGRSTHGVLNAPSQPIGGGGDGDIVREEMAYRVYSVIRG